MDHNQPELTFEESVAQVMQTLPPVVRAYLSQGKYTAVAKALMAKYSLRIDQAGVLEREIMLLLMGIENPDEFTKTLTEEAKLSKQSVDGIVQDVNEQIFIPLRAEEMKSAATQMAPRQQSYAPPLQSPRYVQSEKQIVHPPLPVPPPRPTIIAAPAPALLKAMQGTAMESSKLLEDHEEPHIEFNKAPTHPPTSSEVRPSPVIPKVEPRTPANLPGAVMPRVIPPGGRQERIIQKPESPAVPITPPAPLKATQGTAPPPKAYSADPYREPIG